MAHAKSGLITRGWENAYARILMFALAYYLASKLGLAFVAQPEGLAAIWLAGGVALAMLLLRPKREWPVILATVFIVNCLSNLISGNSLLISASFAFANTLEPALAGWLMVRLRGEKITFYRLGDVLALIGVATLANALTAAVGALVPTIGFGATYGKVWLIWWISDGLGMLAVTPFLVTWMQGHHFSSALTSRRSFETVMWLFFLSAAAWFVFGVSGIDIYLEQRPYMFFPLLIWVALRFSPRASATAIILLSTISLGCTAAGLGIFPLGGHTPWERLLGVQGFFFVASITMMMLSAVFSEYQQSQTDLQDSHARLTATLNALPDLLFEVDRDGIIYDFRAPDPEALYAPPENFLMKSMFDILPEEAATVIGEAIAVAAEQGLSFGGTYSLPLPQGASWFELSVAAKGDSKSPEARFITLVRDITSRKRAEQALGESEFFFRESQRAAFVGSYKTDFIAGFWESSETLDQIFGIGQSYLRSVQGWLDIIHPDDREMMSLYLTDEVIAKRQPFNKEYRIIRQSDGETRWVLGMGEIAFNTGGDVVSLIGTIQDITERKQAEMDRERLLVELERKNRELESLLYVASHDLRSPLVNVQGFGRNLQRYFTSLQDMMGTAKNLDEFQEAAQPLLSERVPKALQFIDTSSSKMDTLIDGLLRVSRAGRVTLQSKAVDMDVLLQNILDSLAFQIEEANAQVHIASPLIACFADKSQLNQVFSNIIDNAIKYRSPDRQLQITVTSRSEGQNVIYAIRDNGIGIATKNQDKIWELFRRLDASETTIPGEGLGLTIARRIIERHGGKTWVESEPGAGSQFFIELPLADRENQ